MSTPLAAAIWRALGGDGTRRPRCAACLGRIWLTFHFDGSAIVACMACARALLFLTRNQVEWARHHGDLDVPRGWYPRRELAVRESSGEHGAGGRDPGAGDLGGGLDRDAARRNVRVALAG